MRIPTVALLTFLGTTCLTVLAFGTASSAASQIPDERSPSTPQKIDITDADSERRFPEEVSPKPGSPNIIYIVLDDTGFSDLGSFGSEISTPSMDWLARGGLRFNNFHTRAICSPTRASLLTGRNSHSVGVSIVTNRLTGFPNGNAQITHSAATVAEILQASGYRTFAVGKWHLAPLTQTSIRDQWPVSRGFEQYYGFLDGMTDQYQPDLVVDNTPIDPPQRPDYHLSVDLVDRAISYVAAAKASSPDRPYFLYLSFGATHAPHQVPKAFIDKYDAVYQKGWDRVREERFARQKALGVIPAEAELTPRNPDVRAWESLSSVERVLNARFQATYAGFLEHTDVQIGRLISFLERSGQLDNTLIVLMSDNGGSIEGHETGTLNEVGSLNGVKEAPDEMVKSIGAMGSEKTYQNYPSGWAQVSNTPFKFYKTTVWQGGLRAPLIVYGQPLVKQGGQVRSQFIDVSDITPTILETVGIKVPEMMKGVPQMPMSGLSFRQVFNDPSAPTPHRTQYFELLGQRAIWHNGWMAIASHQPGAPLTSDIWTLYDTKTDFSGNKDLAMSNPAIIEDLKTRWWIEAGKYGVLPVVNAPLKGTYQRNTKSGFKNRRDPRAEYTYYPEQGVLLRQDGPQIGRESFSITAKVKLPENPTSGVLISAGDGFGGYSLYLVNNYLTFEQSDFGHRSQIRTKIPANAKVSELGISFHRLDADGGIVELLYGNRVVAREKLGRKAADNRALSAFSVGRDAGGLVSDSYPSDNGFPLPAGILDRVVVRVLPDTSP